jgi:hypothetical protein
MAAKVIKAIIVFLGARQTTLNEFKVQKPTISRRRNRAAPESVGQSL